MMEGTTKVHRKEQVQIEGRTGAIFAINLNIWKEEKMTEIPEGSNHDIKI